MEIRDCMKQKVISILDTATVWEAARVCVEQHVGTLPIVDKTGCLIGVLGLSDLLKLELPDFVDLLSDVDFVHDFGAVETTRPTPELLQQPVRVLMRPVTSVVEDCGLLRAYALMRQHNLHDIPVVTNTGTLVGIASRVDIGTAILAVWKIEK